MADYIDISNWKRQIHLHTGGTRDKFITMSPSGDKYYFKTSMKREYRDYKYEFWSEIIAYEVGNMLGFNILRYDIASFDDTIGCISKSIIDEDKEEHHEGYRYIVQKYPEFAINFKKKHSLQYIIDSLENVHLKHLTPDVIKMIVFDAIIGNTDRHSENWALVINKQPDFQEIENAIASYNKKSVFAKIVLSIFLLFNSGTTIRAINRKFQRLRTSFSPIYDSGSSLGRELSVNKLEDLINDGEKMGQYINKGLSDIRWEDHKMNHIELLKTIHLDYGDILNAIIQDVKRRYSKQSLSEIVNRIDEKVPPRFSGYKIPSQRKRFLIQYIDLRVSKIIEVYESVL